ARCERGSRRLDAGGEFRPGPAPITPDQRRTVRKAPRGLEQKVREIAGRDQRTASASDPEFATAAPPMLSTPATSAFGNCMAPAWPVSCIAVMACIDTPVAPIGWPFAFSPPDGLTGNRPSLAVQPCSTARAPWPTGV